ncbi:hypothetical protein DKP78_14815 [Enterococcus faecium]|nr:hypothetical protein DKP78_14815 [Enterococcus faecium]
MGRRGIGLGVFPESQAECVTISILTLERPLASALPASERRQTLVATLDFAYFAEKKDLNAQQILLNRTYV